MLETTSELCKRLKVCDETVRRMVRDGRIPAEYTAKVGDRWRFNGEAIERHLLEKETPCAGTQSA